MTFSTENVPRMIIHTRPPTESNQMHTLLPARYGTGRLPTLSVQTVPSCLSESSGRYESHERRAARAASVKLTTGTFASALSPLHHPRGARKAESEGSVVHT